MHLSPGTPHHLHGRPATGELLGPAHPLAHVEDKLAVLHARSLVVAALLCAGIAAFLDGLATGLPRAGMISHDVRGGSDACRRPPCPLPREGASAGVGEGVHDLVVKLVDPAPCQQALGDRTLKRRTRLVVAHIELPAHQLQASLLKLIDRLEDLSDRQHHRADKRYPGPRGAPAVGRAPRGASADSPPRLRGAGPLPRWPR
jgi:hypothetical protein